MRTRKEIEKEIVVSVVQDYAICSNQKKIIEVLLDIRDLLQNPPVEITGEPYQPKE